MEEKKKKKLIWQIPFLIFLIVGTIIIVKQQRNAPYQHDTGFVFGTVYHITYQCDENLKPQIEAQLAQVDQEFSMFNKQSTVSKINRRESPALNKMFLEVYN